MLPHLFPFPQDPMPGPNGESSGITHGLATDVGFTAAGARVVFQSGTVVDGEFTQDTVRAAKLLGARPRTATWDEVNAALAAGSANLIGAALSATWERYRVEEGLPPDPTPAGA